uniref:Sh2 domain-containing protein n=1 Tax=Tetraselmis sp. GSL018 TaxID=582737 RepID=A0A061RK97_9CHLO
MTGTLPEVWSTMQELRRFFASSQVICNGPNEAANPNCLSGTLPPPWSNMASLTNFTITSSSIGGTLPDSWGALTNNMEFFSVENSRITGDLPASWSDWTAVEVIDLSENNITGPVPSSWLDALEGRFRRIDLSGNFDLCSDGVSPPELSAALCREDSPECLDLAATDLSNGVACQAPLYVIVAVIVVFVVVLVGAMCLLQILHRKRKKRPLAPILSTSRLSQVNRRYQKYLQTKTQGEASSLRQGAGNEFRAEDALNPDLWDTQFLDRFDQPGKSALPGASQGNRSGSQHEGARDVGSYWPAEETDIIIGKQPSKTPEEIAAEAEERRRKEKEQRRLEALATTHNAAMASFNAVMSGVDDYYGREALELSAGELRGDRQRPATWGGAFPSLEAPATNSTKPSLARLQSIRPLPALWQLDSLNDVQDVVDLNIDFKTEVQPFIEKRIGGGAFGDVYKGTFRGKPTAIKLFSRYYQGDQEEIYNSFVSEVKLMSKFQNCDRIVRILGASLQQPYVCILLEFVCGPSLASRIYDETLPPLTYQQILELGHDIATALAYLHPTVVHRDLKPDNILLDESGRAKLIDFGISRGKDPFKSYIMTQTGGTPIYMAPEQFNSPKFDEKADVYALGCILYEMFARSPPWKGYSHFCQIIVAVAFNNERPPIPEGCPENLKRLINKCWRQDPASRPSCAEIVRLLEIMLSDNRESQKSLYAVSSVSSERPRVPSSTHSERALRVDKDAAGVRVATSSPGPLPLSEGTGWGTSMSGEGAREDTPLGLTPPKVEDAPQDIEKGRS